MNLVSILTKEDIQMENLSKSARESDVIIRSVNSKNSHLGYMVSISIKTGIKSLYFDSGKVEIRPRGKKLVFINSTDKNYKESNGYNLHGIGMRTGFKISDREKAPQILTYVGNFNFIKDEVRGWYYIDLDNPGGRDNQKQPVQEKYVTDPNDAEWFRALKERQKKNDTSSQQSFNDEYVKLCDEENARYKETIKELEAKLKTKEEEIVQLKASNDEVSLKLKDKENEINKISALNNETIEKMKNLVSPEKYKERCINLLRKCLSNKEYEKAQTINELITQVFESVY